MIVCVCENINDTMIRESVRAGNLTVEDVKKCTNACSNCETCYHDICDIIVDEQARGK